jgi:hypothetical protein
MSDPLASAVANGILSPQQPIVVRCPKTGRPYEVGHGALSHAEQTAMFEHQARIAADRPMDGEACPQTGRPYEIGSGALPKSLQSARFLEELSPEAKTERQEQANALFAIEPVGRA